MGSPVQVVGGIALVAVLASRRVRSDPAFVAAAILYVGVLVPYVLVSHYLRYQVPLIGLQSLFTFYVGAEILGRLAAVRDRVVR